MSQLPDAEIAIIVRRHNASRSDDRSPVQVRDIMARITKIRNRGYMFHEDAEGWTMATPLPGIVEPGLAIATGALATAHDVDIARLHAIQMDMLTRHLGSARNNVAG